MVPISLHQELELQPVMLGPQAWEPSLLLWSPPLLPVLVHFPAVEATSASSSVSQSIKLAKENPFFLNLFDFQNFLHYSTTQYILHPLFSFRLFVSPYFWQVYIFYTCHYILLKLYPSFWFVYLLSLNLGLLQPDINTNANLGAAGAEALFICFPHWPPLLCFITQSSALTTACPSVSFQCLCLGPSILFCLLSL